MPFIESFNEFRDRQNSPYVHRDRDGDFIFQNGAYSDGNIHRDPPEDDFQRLKIVRLYYSHRLQRASAEHASCKREFNAQIEIYRKYGGGGPIVSPDAYIPALKDLAKRKEELEATVADLDRQLMETPQGQQFQEARKRKEEKAAQMNQKVSEWTEILNTY